MYVCPFARITASCTVAKFCFVLFYRNNKDIQLSKLLSWLLRHGAVKEGFRLSSEGYIEVSKLLNHSSFKGKYTLSDIQRVVTNNDKQRFKLRSNPNTNVLEIKANQGHTISEVSTAELIPILEPKYKTVIHGTYLKCWPQIKEQGLCCMARQHIHLAKGTVSDKTVISGMRGSAQIHIYVDLAKALSEGIQFYESDNGVILTSGNEKGYLEPTYFLKVVKASSVVGVNSRRAAAVVKDGSHGSSSPPSHPAQPSRDSIISAQHSLEGAIASPKTKKVLENGLVKNNGRKMESSSPQPGSIRTPTSPFHVRNIEAEAIADRSSSAPGTPQNTLPAVQDFLQMAFDTVQRTKHSQPSSAPATDRPSLLGPFPSTEKPTNHTASATNTPFKKLTAKRTGTSKSLEQTSSPEARRPSTSQGISRSQSYPGYIFYNTSLQNKQATPPKRSILVAKRRNPVSKAAADTGNSGEKSAEETKAISNTKESTPEKKKPGQKGKQNSSRVAQTFKEFKERGRTDAQNGAGTQQAAAGTQQAAAHRNWRRGKQTLLNDDVDPNTRVLVSGFPAYTASSELVRVLSVHGACSVESCRNRLAVVRFERAEDAATARAAAPPVLYGELLELKPYTNARHVDDLYRAYRKVVATQKGEDVTMPNELDLSGDFFQQMEVIERAIRLTEEQQQAVAKLYADLEAVLQTEWPGCVAVPFGSIPAGLGMKSSDADCFVQLPAPERGAAFVARARRLLARYPAVFAQLVAIPRANTPIVKFRHLPSGFHCDVSAKTPLGAQNSRLIKLLLGADPRLPRLALLLKYWARVHALSGTGRLTNYALTMLLVFYLQRPGVGLLPPVARLQRPPARPYLVDHWDAGFAPRLPAPERPPPAADLPLPDLFGGFFDFYAAFDFDELVVCPLLGEPVPKAAFEPGGELPPGLARYVANVRDKLVGPIRHAVPFCVQDPFELSHNVASGVSARLAADFLACARAAAVPAARRAAELPRAALAPRPARAAPASTLQLLPRLRARLPPDWRAALRDVLLHDIFRDMLQLRLQRARDDAQRPRRRAKYECERYTAAAGAPVWRRRRAGAVPPGPPAEAAAALVARQAAVTAEIARGPRAALEFELELWFREEPRHCSLGVKMLHGDVDSFRQLVSFVHTVMVDWCRVLLRPRAPEPDDVARRLAAVSLALDAAPS